MIVLRESKERSRVDRVAGSEDRHVGGRGSDVSVYSKVNECEHDFECRLIDCPSVKVYTREKRRKPKDEMSESVMRSRRGIIP